MRKRSVSVEWHVAESEAEWKALRAEQATNAAAGVSGSRSRWITTLLLLLVMGGALWYWQGRQDATLSTLEEHAASATVAGLTAADVIATQTMITSMNHTTATTQVTLAPLPTRPELFTADVARIVTAVAC